jgi:hypothetical protein
MLIDATSPRINSLGVPVDRQRGLVRPSALGFRAETPTGRHGSRLTAALPPDRDSPSVVHPMRVVLQLTLSM